MKSDRYTYFIFKDKVNIKNKSKPFNKNFKRFEQKLKLIYLFNYLNNN